MSTDDKVFIPQAVEFIKKHEGFISKPIWDVNAWRIGYGSDTLTLPDGTIRKVAQSDTTTQSLALKNLEHRIGTEFIPKIKNKVGGSVFESQTNGTKTALVSFAYNYGNIVKKSIVDALKTNDAEAISRAWISSTWDDNKTLSNTMRTALRKRRLDEAMLIDPNVKSRTWYVNYIV